MNFVDIDLVIVNVNDLFFGEGLGLDFIDGLEIVVILERDYNIIIIEIESLILYFELLVILVEFVVV